MSASRIVITLLGVVVGLAAVACEGGPGQDDLGADLQDASRGEDAIDAATALDTTPDSSPDVPTERIDTSDTADITTADLPMDAEIIGECGGDGDCPPTVSFSAPEGGALVRGVVELAVAAGDDDGVIMVRFLVDGGLLVEDQQVPWKTDWDTTEFDDGPHALEAVAFDTGGNSASAEIEVIVDNTPPELTLLAPAEGAILHDTILLVADASDEMEMDRVEFVVDDGEPVAVTEEPWEVEYDGTELIAGIHAVIATAFDAAGNETSVEGEFLVDRPPVVAFLAPAPDALVPGPVTVQAEAADDVDLQGVSLALDAEWYGDLAVSRGTWEIQWTPIFVKAERVLTLTATDSVGQETAASMTVLVDHPVTVALQLCEEAICEALEPDTELTGTIQLRAVAQDDGADIAAVDFLVDGDPAHQDLEEPFDFQWVTTSVEDGALALEAVASNALDETGSAQVPVLVNNCDLDHDGFVAAGCDGPDCDDGAEDFNPEAPDLVGDDTDQNCDGLDGVDGDGDGYASQASGGDDCLDDDAAAHPCGDDLPGDGVDGNCDGVDALSCDDCVLCTVDGLVGGQCVHAPVGDGGPCDDGDLCTGAGTCQDLVCLLGDALDCDDDNPCTADGCAPDAGCYNLPLDGAPCPGGGTCLGDSCCVPACDGKGCGPDGCGGSCGSCPDGQLCTDNLCCTPDCLFKVCGDDGCGGSCGSCGCGEECLDGQCINTACTGKECGPDGCGDSCGNCDDGDPCTIDVCQMSDGTCHHSFNGDPDCCTPLSSVFTDSFPSANLTTWYVPEEGASCGIAPFGCEDAEGENCMNCPTDCGPCPVSWSVTADQSVTAPYSLYFGNPAQGNYDNGVNSVRGFIASPDVALPPYGIPAVSFQLWLDTEHTPIWWVFEQPVDIDTLRLHVQSQTGEAYSELTEIWNSQAWEFKGSTFDEGLGIVTWKTVYATLDGLDLEGATVRFVFEFDSFDASNNDYQGVYVDDFKTFTLCDETFECLSAYDCPETTPEPENPDCSVELCDGANGAAGISGTCVAEANALLDDCCIQDVIIGTTVDFDSPCGMEDWIASPTPLQTPVAWQIWGEADGGENNTPGGECALYFGDPEAGNYDDPGQAPQGIVTSPAWEIPEGLQEVEVNFWLWMDLGEDTWSLTDVLSLHMGLRFHPSLPVNEEMVIWSKPCDLNLGLCSEPLLQNYCDQWGCTIWPWGQWKHVSVVIPAALFLGYSHLNFWFDFDTQDTTDNDNKGVFVDDFEVRDTCG